MFSLFSIRFVAAAFVFVSIARCARAEMMLYVGAANGQSVQRFNAITGQFIGNFATANEGGDFLGQSSLAFDSVGGFFVGEWNYTQAIRRYDGNTGAYISTIGSHDFASALAFGPDGNLYAAGLSGGINRHDGITGALLGSFANSSGDYTRFSGMRFGPDGNLYTIGHTQVIGEVGVGTLDIQKYNGATGTFLGNFIPDFGAYFGNLGDLVFGPDGNLYVSLSVENVVRRYNGMTGAFIDDFASGGGMNMPFGLTFGPDGNLYVASHGSGSVLRYNGTTGEFIDTFATGSNLGPTYLLFADTATVPEPSVLALGAATMLLFGHRGRHRLK